MNRKLLPDYLENFNVSFWDFHKIYFVSYQGIDKTDFRLRCSKKLLFFGHIAIALDYIAE